MMPQRTIVTTLTTGQGKGPSLALTHEADGSYRVGLLDETWRLTFLEQSVFLTYASAHDRLEHEALERTRA